jgi:hypothetical protein
VDVAAAAGAGEGPSMPKGNSGASGDKLGDNGEEEEANLIPSVDHQS